MTRRTPPRIDVPGGPRASVGDDPVLAPSCFARGRRSLGVRTRPRSERSALLHVS